MVSVTQQHRKLERNVTLLGAFAFVAVAIGGIVGGQGVPALGAMILMVVAALAVTDEYRTGLIEVTLAVTPRRSVVLAAKALVNGVAAALWSVLLVLAAEYVFAAAARGAVIIEKHFTLDRSLPGPDQKASINPDELRELVVSVREVEKLLGSGEKKVAPSEFLNRDVARKSLTTLCSIKKGDPFTVENLGTKRPGAGISALHYWEYLGKTADRDYAEDERIEPWRRQ